MIPGALAHLKGNALAQSNEFGLAETKIAESLMEGANDTGSKIINEPGVNIKASGVVESSSMAATNARAGKGTSDNVGASNNSKQ
jgi:hypothetical protein